MLHWISWFQLFPARTSAAHLEGRKVTGYVGKIQVFPKTDEGSAFVLWTSSWESSEGGVAEFCNPVYQGLLGDLKAHFASS